MGKHSDLAVHAAVLWACEAHRLARTELHVLQQRQSRKSSTPVCVAGPCSSFLLSQAILSPPFKRAT